MVPGSQATADVPAGRSGGKILKARRTAARTTPYDRPTPPQPEPPLLQSESPSWLGGLAMPAKFVAGGASKIFSSLWSAKSWAAASSDSDSEPEDDSEDDENPVDDENPDDDIIELNQKGSSSQKTEILQLVEQLLMLEKYSREECDKLIEIINSRVVDYAGPSIIFSKPNNEPENEAVMEARKWVAENKARSGKKSDLDNGLYSLKYIMTPQAKEEEGSPVEVAKSYMKTRPPWASPLKHENSFSPSPLTEWFKERTPYSSDGGLSFQKKDYLSGGSWNIHDEIRKVRSKASEDLINSHRPIKLLEPSVENHNSIVDLNTEGEEKEEEGGKGEENGKVNENCILLTESTDIPAVNNSQDSINSNEQNLVGKGDEKNRAVTRGTRNRVKGRGRGK